MKERLKWLSFGCNHDPIMFEPYRQWLLKQIHDYQPDFLIHHGDAIEANGASRWELKEGQDPCVIKEFHALERTITQLNEAAPNAKKFFLYGNHDSNLLHAERVPKAMRKLVQHYWSTIQDGVMKDWHFPCHKYGHDQYFRLGQITFQHGANTGNSPRLDHLVAQAVEYGVPFGLHVSAHTHAPVPVTQAELSKYYLPYWVANVGTGMDWEQAGYMERASKHKWGRGLVRGTVSKASVTQYKSYYKSPQWTAELLVHSWASRNRFTPDL